MRLCVMTWLWHFTWDRRGNVKRYALSVERLDSGN